MYLERLQNAVSNFNQLDAQDLDMEIHYEEQLGYEITDREMSLWLQLIGLLGE